MTTASLPRPEGRRQDEPVDDFKELAASRREWIDNVLKLWCRRAALKDLLRADLEWADIAGQVDPQSTLWTWAWGRFPDLVHEGLAGVNETHEVQVTLKNGRIHTGFPDNRKTEKGRLALLTAGSETAGK